MSFLLYDLSTRLGIEKLATCSALTASASRTQHFNALSQLDKILGVSCFESVAEFVDWLRAGRRARRCRGTRCGFEPRIVGSEAAELQDDDRSIVAYLFRDSTEVDLEPLHGGFSDATVWRAVSRDALGQEHAPAVVKLGPNRTIAQERVAFEQVEEVLGNNAPRVRGFVDLADRAGLKYSYAAMGQGGVRTLQSMFAAERPDRAAGLDRADRLRRDPRAAVRGGPVRAAAALLRSTSSPPTRPRTCGPSSRRLVPDANRKTLEFPGGLELPNVCGFYDELPCTHPSSHAGLPLRVVRARRSQRGQHPGRRA